MASRTQTNMENFFFGSNNKRNRSSSSALVTAQTDRSSSSGIGNLHQPPPHSHFTGAEPGREEEGDFGTGGDNGGGVSSEKEKLLGNSQLGDKKKSEAAAASAAEKKEEEKKKKRPLAGAGLFPLWCLLGSLIGLLATAAFIMSLFLMITRGHVDIRTDSDGVLTITYDKSKKFYDIELADLFTQMGFQHSKLCPPSGPIQMIPARTVEQMFHMPQAEEWAALYLHNTITNTDETLYRLDQDGYTVHIERTGEFLVTTLIGIVLLDTENFTTVLSTDDFVTSGVYTTGCTLVTGNISLDPTIGPPFVPGSLIHQKDRVAMECRSMFIPILPAYAIHEEGEVSLHPVMYITGSDILRVEHAPTTISLYTSLMSNNNATAGVTLTSMKLTQLRDITIPAKDSQNL